MYIILTCIFTNVPKLFSAITAPLCVCARRTSLVILGGRVSFALIFMACSLDSGNGGHGVVAKHTKLRFLQVAGPSLRKFPKLGESMSVFRTLNVRATTVFIRRRNGSVSVLLSGPVEEPLGLLQLSPLTIDLVQAALALSGQLLPTVISVVPSSEPEPVAKVPVMDQIAVNFVRTIIKCASVGRDFLYRSPAMSRHRTCSLPEGSGLWPSPVLASFGMS